MNPIPQSLPGIKKVFYLPADKITPSVIKKYISGIPIAILANLYPVTIFDSAIVEYSTEYDNNGSAVTSTLKFSSIDTFPHNHIVWIAVDVSNNAYLIGSSELLPTIKSTGSSGTPSGDSKSVAYEIKWLAPCPPIPCSIVSN